MPPFPIALCGKNSTLASSFVKIMDAESEFQVVTVFHTTNQATSELQSLLAASSTTTSLSTKPASGLGSNASAATSTAPQAIIIGAGFSGDEVGIMRQNLAGVAGAEKLAWFTPAKIQAQRPGQPGFMEAVVGRAQDALRERRVANGEVQPGVHGF